MKKSFIFLSFLFIFLTNLLAEQPVFLQKWIIPEEATWGEFYRLPEHKGMYQTTGLGKAFDYVHILPSIEMPPYFVKNHLADWKMPFSEILQAMNNNEDFSVYTQPEYKQFKNNLLCSTSIIAVYKTNPTFKVVLTFAYCNENERDSRNPTSFQIHYSGSQWQVPSGGSLRSSVIMRAGQKNKAYTEKEIKDFFDTNYKRLWYSLPEAEKYAIAFSSNLFETNGQFHLDFGNHYEFGNTVGYGKKTLNQSCGINSYSSLMKMVNSLLEEGHSKAYNDLLDLLKKYPHKSVLKIAKKEHLDILSISRLYWVAEMKDKLGSHGIEAWDEGRVITWIRWSVGAGYISYDEAINLIVPIIDNIRQNYNSWDDYMAHYIAGRSFYSLSSSKYKNNMTESLAAVKTCRAYIPYETLTFHQFNVDKQHIMTVSDSQYTPSKEGLKWEEFRTLYAAKDSSYVLEDLIILEKKYPEYSDIVYGWHLALMIKYTKDKKEIYKYVKAHYKYFSKLPHDDPIYEVSMIFYR